MNVILVIASLNVGYTTRVNHVHIYWFESDEWMLLAIRKMSLRDKNANHCSMTNAQEDVK